MINKRLALVIVICCLLVGLTIGNQGIAFGNRSRKEISAASEKDAGKKEKSPIHKDQGDKNPQEEPSDIGEQLAATIPDTSVPDASGEDNSYTEEDHNPQDDSNSNQSSEPAQTDFFPCSLPNTNLIVEGISDYSGIYLEDGSDEAINHVATAILKNEGSTVIEYASFTVQNGTRTLTFAASDIPPGGKVVAQESEKKKLKGKYFHSLDGAVAERSSLDQAEDQILVTENDDGSLTVSNISSTDIPCVRLFYKFYLEDEDAYVGGITYTAKINDLTANSTQNVNPSHYTKGYSKIVMIRTYDSAE